MAASPALIMMLVYGIETRSSGIRHARQQAVDIARTLAEDQRDRIEEAQRLITALAGLPAIRDQDEAVCGTMLAHLLQGYSGYTALGVAAVDGTVTCSAPPVAGRVTLADRPIFQQVLATRRAAVGEYVIGRASGRPSIGVALPITGADGSVAGVIYTALDPRDLSARLASAMLLPPGASVTLLDRNNVILARQPDPDAWVGRRLPEGWAGRRAPREEGPRETRGGDLDEKSMVYGFARLGQKLGDSTVIVGLDKQAVVSEANSVFGWTLLSLLLVIAVASVIASVAAVHLVVRPVRSLLRAAQHLGAGDLAARASIEGTPELQELARGFNRMAEALRERTTQVIEAEQRYRGLFERNLAGIFLIARNGAILECNPAFARILGYPSVDAMKAVKASEFHADAGQLAAFLATLDAGQVLTNCEFRARRLDGSEVWLSAHVAEVPGSAERLFTGMMVDVSDRKRAEKAEREAEELRALMRERQRIAEDLHDGIIQSIYATGLVVQEGLRLLEDRREAAARACLQEAGAQLDTVIRDVRSYVTGLQPKGLDGEGLSRALGDVAKGLELNALATVEVDTAPNVEDALTPQMTRELFHIGREALANVVKHARGAHATVSLSGASGLVSLRIEDDGCGFSTEATRSGRGLRNIEERVRRLGGRLAVESAIGQGTRITVDVPIDERA